jgi:hypothetical protein
MSGDVHRCFTFWRKFESCLQEELEPHVMCRDDFEDYTECFRRKKEMRLKFQVYQELHKWKVLAVPQYNEMTDSFEPMRLPLNPDDYFK